MWVTLGPAAAFPPFPGTLRLRRGQLLLAGLTRSQEQEAAGAGAGTRLQAGSGQVVLAPILTRPLCSCDTNRGQVIWPHCASLLSSVRWGIKQHQPHRGVVRLK